MMIRIKKDTKLVGTIKALMAVAFGVFLIVTKVNAMTLIVQVVAAGILVMGLLPLLLSVTVPSMGHYTGGVIYKIIIATILFLLAGPIAGVIRYIVGGVLCLVGISQIFSVLSMRRAYAGGLWMFVFPVMILALGAMFFSEELVGKDLMGQFAGIAAILYGVSKGMTTWNIGTKRTSGSRYAQFEDNTVDEQ